MATPELDIENVMKYVNKLNFTINRKIIPVLEKSEDEFEGLLDLLCLFSPLEKYTKDLSEKCYTEMRTKLTDVSNTPNKKLLNLVYKCVCNEHDLSRLSNFLRCLFEVATFRSEIGLAASILHLIAKGIENKSTGSQMKIRNLLFTSDTSSHLRSRAADLISSSESPENSEHDLQDDESINDELCKLENGQFKFSLWCLAYLQRHYDPSVEKLANGLMDAKLKTANIFEDYNLEKCLDNFLAQSFIDLSPDSDNEGKEKSRCKKDWGNSFLGSCYMKKYRDLCSDPCDVDISKYDFYKECTRNQNKRMNLRIESDDEEVEIGVWDQLCAEDEFLRKFIINPKEQFGSLPRDVMDSTLISSAFVEDSKQIDRHDLVTKCTRKYGPKGKNAVLYPKVVLSDIEKCDKIKKAKKLETGDAKTVKKSIPRIKERHPKPNNEEEQKNETDTPNLMTSTPAILEVPRFFGDSSQSAISLDYSELSLETAIVKMSRKPIKKLGRKK